MIIKSRKTGSQKCRRVEIKKSKVEKYIKRKMNKQKE